MNDFTEWLNNQHEQYIDSVAQGYPNQPETPRYYSKGGLMDIDNPEILEEDELLILKQNDK